MSACRPVVAYISLLSMGSHGIGSECFAAEPENGALLAYLLCKWHVKLQYLRGPL